METGAQRFDKDLWATSQNGGVDLSLGPSKHHDDSRAKFNLNMMKPAFFSTFFFRFAFWQLLYVV